MSLLTDRFRLSNTCKILLPIVKRHHFVAVGLLHVMHSVQGLVAGRDNKPSSATFPDDQYPLSFCICLFSPKAGAKIRNCNGRWQLTFLSALLLLFLCYTPTSRHAQQNSHRCHTVDAA